MQETRKVGTVIDFCGELGKTVNQVRRLLLTSVQLDSGAAVLLSVDVYKEQIILKHWRVVNWFHIKLRCILKKYRPLLPCNSNIITTAVPQDRVQKVRITIRPLGDIVY